MKKKQTNKIKIKCQAQTSSLKKGSVQKRLLAEIKLIAYGQVLNFNSS